MKLNLNPTQLGWSILASSGALFALEGLLSMVLEGPWLSGQVCEAAGRGCRLAEGAAGVFLLWSGAGLFALSARAFQSTNVGERRFAAFGCLAIVAAEYALFFALGTLHHAEGWFFALPHHRFQATGTFLALAGLALAWPRDK